MITVVPYQDRTKETAVRLVENDLGGVDVYVVTRDGTLDQRILNLSGRGVLIYSGLAAGHGLPIDDRGQIKVTVQRPDCMDDIRARLLEAIKVMPGECVVYLTPRVTVGELRRLAEAR
jgi:hypothetical protein